MKRKMLNLRIAIYQFDEIFTLNEQRTRFGGILGVHYQDLFDAMKWNVTLVDANDIKSNFSDKKFDNDAIFHTNLVSQNLVDFYFNQIQIGDMVEEQNIRLSPAVSFTTTRLLQCIHRRDEDNNRDILAALRELSAAFWLKLASIFLLLSLILITFYFARSSQRRTRHRRSTSLRRKLSGLILFLFLFYCRIITRQSSNRLIYSNLFRIRYLLLLVVILFSVVIHQVMFYTAFRDLKFRNTSYILRDLNQILRSPDIEPCFLESESKS